MSQDYTTIYQKARKTTPLTQEQAAERLETSVESVKAYELGGRLPPNAMVARMVAVYDTPWLALEHLQVATAPLAVLPEVRVQSLPEATLTLIDKATALADEYRSLVKITADGRIDDNEEQAFEGIKAAIRDVIAAGFQVIYPVEGIKKNRPEEATSRRFMSDRLSQSNDRKNIIPHREPYARGNFTGNGGEFL